MALNLGQITPEMMKSLEEAKVRECEFWARHGVSDEGHVTGQATPAHRAWVKAVEHEYKLMGKEVRVHLDTPIARKAFIIGYRAALKNTDSLSKESDK